MATEEFGTAVFKDGKMVPLDAEGDSFEFPEPDEIDIEIVDDTPPEDKNRKPMPKEALSEEVTDEELDEYDAKVQKRIKKLTKGYHDIRREKDEATRMREEAIRVAQVLLDENKRLQSTLHEGSKVYIEQGKQGAEVELTMAKKAYKEAYDSGDSDALVEAQQRISEATLKLDKVYNLRPIEPKEQEVYIPQATQEAPAQDEKLTTWLDNNSWYGGESQEEDEMTGLALTIHNRLAREYGEKYIGTDDYYQKIDSTIRKRFPDYFGSAEETEVEPAKNRANPAKTRAKPAASVVAPATRSVAPKKVQLTPTQVQIAKRLGVPLELYAKKVAEQTNGER